ncbi:MAG TPA: PHP domain-containing protein [Streptosporangiaceae bacterium]
MRADLHVHSNASDGTDDPAEVMRRAAAAGLDVVALTDHDTTAGHARARAALTGSLILLPGMELSSELAGRSVHLLAYLFDPAHPGLAAETARIRDDRVLRAQGMVRKLNALGAPVSWERVAGIAGDSVIGRPHIARAMAQAGVVAEPADAFTKDWIADDGRAYVEKYALPPARAIGLVRDAGGVAVLAHPRAGRDWDLSDEQIANLTADGLAGIEVWHRDHGPEERTALLALATRLGLIPTGGSDDHGELTGYSIGSELAAPDTYDRLLAAAGAAAAPGSP